MQIERRQTQIRVEPSQDDAGGLVMRGIAVPYGELSHVLRDRPRPYRERFQPGAVSTSADTVLIYGHDLSNVPLARVGADTLRFDESDDGLSFEARIAPGPVATALERGDLDGSVSVGFILDRDTWQNRTNPAGRTVHAATLVELSVVMAGAYESAKGTVA